VATVLIKKYGNRRLYDTSDSRYVTLDELAQKIRSGSDLRIVDAQTGEDLTQATLTQIVLETGNAAKFLPVQLLTQMIRLSDDSLAEFFSRYVTGALDVYLQAKRGMQTISGFNPLTQLPMAAGDALARMWMQSPFGAPTPYPGQYGGYAAPPPPYPVAPSPIPGEPGDDEQDLPPRSKRAGSRSDADGRDAGDDNGSAPSRKSRPAMERPSRPAMDQGQSDDVAAMRRELDELKGMLRDSLPKKRGPKKKS
jgi:polyhydroxyalkanoate synthesis repressor PhaR